MYYSRELSATVSLGDFFISPSAIRIKFYLHLHKLCSIYQHINSYKLPKFVLIAPIKSYELCLTKDLPVN